MRKAFAASIASILLLALSLPAQAQKEVIVNSFRSATLWPLWAAQKQGYFAKQGIVIKNVYTPNSSQQMIGLLKGEFDMVTTALDNVVAYNLGDGNPKAPKNADLITVTGGTNGANSLIAQPGIKSMAELRGRDLAVDAVTTGYAFVLQEILAKNGLTPKDYKLVPFGNTGARWVALKDKKAAAGLLAPPVSQTAVREGFVNLAEAATALGGYQGTVFATRREWAKSNSDMLVNFIRAYRQGLEWVKAPANKEAVIAILRAEIPTTSQAAAEQTYDFLVANPQGFDPGGKIDMAGAKMVLDLRRRYGPPGRSPEIARMVDESYFERAAKP